MPIMDFEVLEQEQVQEQPYPGYRVKYRTEDCVIHEREFGAAPGVSPHEAIKDIIAAEEWFNGPKAPPAGFGMFLKMDMSGRSDKELRQAYRQMMDERGYDVDKDMVPRKREPA